jgi:hypothetical protein
MTSNKRIKLNLTNNETNCNIKKKAKREKTTTPRKARVKKSTIGLTKPKINNSFKCKIDENILTPISKPLFGELVSVCLCTCVCVIPRFIFTLS